MSKKSKIFALLASLVIATSASIAGCAGPGNKPPEEPPASEQMQISQETREVGKYDKFSLAVSTELDGDISWESTNDSIAKIERVYVDGNGNYVADITAYGIGSATITATIGEESVSCVVTVGASTYYPVIEFTPSVTEIPLSLDASYTITAKASINGIELNEQLTWYSNDSSVAEYVDGKIVAKGVGQTEIGCEFTFEGNKVFEEITVTVVNDSYVVFSAEQLSLYTIASDGCDKQATVEPTALFVAGQEVSLDLIASAQYVSENESIASVTLDGVNAVVVANGAGDTVINATITLTDGTELTGLITVNVTEATKGQQVLADFVAWAKQTDENGTIIDKDYTIAEDIEGTIESVVIAGKITVIDPVTEEPTEELLETELTPAEYALVDGKLTIKSAAIFGNAGADKIITITTSDAVYKVNNAKLASFAVTKYNDLKGEWAKDGVPAPWQQATNLLGLGAGAATNMGDAKHAHAGYVILANDIVGDGTAFGVFGRYNSDNGKYGFTGTFDGQGFGIYDAIAGNLRPDATDPMDPSAANHIRQWSSMFGNFLQGSTLKDMKIVRLTVGGIWSEGLFTYSPGRNHPAYGNVSNVYVDLTYNMFNYPGRILGQDYCGTVSDSLFILRTGELFNATVSREDGRLPQLAESSFQYQHGNMEKGSAENTIVIVDNKNLIVPEEGGITQCDLTISDGNVVVSNNVIEVAGATKLIELSTGDVLDVEISEAGEITLSEDLAEVGKQFVVVCGNTAKIITLIEG